MTKSVNDNMMTRSH